MEDKDCQLQVVGPLPVLFLPQSCILGGYNVPENAIIHLNISTSDANGNKTVVYNGLCNVKVINKQGNQANIRSSSPKRSNVDENISPILQDGHNISLTVHNESKVWIDPVVGPHVYNRCATPSFKFTSEAQKAQILQNEGCSEDEQYSTATKEGDNKEDVSGQNSDNFSMPKDDSEWRLFQPHFSEETVNEREIKTKDEGQCMMLQGTNEALTLFMSNDAQPETSQPQIDCTATEQTRGIDHIDDPRMLSDKSGDVGNQEVDDVTIQSDDPPMKIYQCNKCKYTFEQLTAFNQHITEHNTQRYYHIASKIRYMCTACGKYLKNEEKFVKHCLGHGNPELECNKCNKVFTSKFALRTHRKIHFKLFPCYLCAKSFSTAAALDAHAAKSHGLYVCDSCPFSCNSATDLMGHQEIHDNDNSTFEEVVYASEQVNKNDDNDPMIDSMKAYPIKFVS